ncbi:MULTISPECIES: amidophosphoribosyltransferase [Commensalibacter]|uniref:Amidophosphoribosyltransferase n=2 Tax=Commensalibacter TaxID=1079922 RepID=W7DVV6_9PROT|nr:MULTISPECIES: amidophosphoribosyltransferase [Commensalibacter]EUK19175.1 amidophosphoribosyltransferase [Commensalibacter papalotli (ex Servin-Garciduenas et al. 2014)]CAI3930661.1 Glutamine phosphoribosylpyrophosphate amidotransferase (PurF) (PDB:1ECB) [Commensalibacter papalotli (ex Botero et al. 2024)]CAI3947991.1 Glutamine phosphoribosylpyrophosphate amidotransferase (PurF) (PDB:1ECB) [Commensalibacter papalotli (ex Botero et al. 2024)]
MTVSPFSSHDLDFTDDDAFHEECGVVGIWTTQDAASLTTLGLHALQHRGQEASGIVTYDGNHFHTHRGLGLVGEVFADPRVIASLPGGIGIGHNRYATTGETQLRNVQPLYADFEFGGLAVAHNGNLTNAQLLKQSLVRRGCLFQSSTDSEVFIHLIAISLYTNVIDRFIDAIKQVQGAYSLVALSKDMLIAARDPLGVRPLILGKLPNSQDDNSWVVASESCALSSMGADFVRDIEPGEVIIIDNQGVRSINPFADHASSRFCIFEYVYFARPDTVIDNKSVYITRQKIGAELAKECHVDADVVVPVPDSGVPAAIGYAAASKIPFELGIIRSHYIGRTFIEPTDQIRNLGVKLKHSTNRAVIEGKRVILIDDSIVRGTTSKKIVEMVRAAGATEVHLRIASPPTRHSCFYGIDTPAEEKLLAHTHNIEQMCKLIGADSLGFVSNDGLYRALEEEKRNNEKPQYCDACFTGDYPISLTDHDMHLVKSK